jgi:hypothetical protein
LLTGSGTAFKDIKPDKKYFPIIGMKKPGETLKANFGQEPFIFDIDKMMRVRQFLPPSTALADTYRWRKWKYRKRFPVPYRLI